MRNDRRKGDIMYCANHTEEYTKDERERLLRAAAKANMPDHTLFPMEWLKSTDFFTAPASTKYHGAYEGGLFDHCINVADTLLRMTRQGLISWERPESPFIIGLLHDATKIGAYVLNIFGEGSCWERNPNWESFGPHGQDSVLKIKQHIELTEEEEYCIRWHMGAYETDQWEGYDRAIRKYPNVLWTHTADMFASKVMEEQSI